MDKNSEDNICGGLIRLDWLPKEYKHGRKKRNCDV